MGRVRMELWDMRHLSFRVFVHCHAGHTVKEPTLKDQLFKPVEFIIEFQNQHQLKYLKKILRFVRQSDLIRLEQTPPVSSASKILREAFFETFPIIITQKADTTEKADAVKYRWTFNVFQNKFRQLLAFQKNKDQDYYALQHNKKPTAA